MRISRRLKERLSSNAEGDRIFRAERDGGRWLYGTNMGKIVSEEAKPVAQLKQGFSPGWREVYKWDGGGLVKRVQAVRR